MMTSKQSNGVVSESMAKAFYSSKGYLVSQPINDFGEYDLIVDDGINLNKIQVKTAYWDTNKQRNLVSLVTSHIRGDSNRYNKKYQEKSFDLLLIVHVETMSFYEIPIKEILGRRSLTVYPNGIPATVNGRYTDFEKYKCKL